MLFKHISLFLIYQLARGVLRGFAFGARANPRQILAPDGFRCIQPSNRLPQTSDWPETSDDSDISPKLCFIFPQTFVVRICLKIGCNTAQRLGNNALFLCFGGVRNVDGVVEVWGNFRGFPISDTIVGHV